MAYLISILQESGLFFLALLIGLYSYRHLNLFNKLIFFQLILFAFIYAGGYAITIYQQQQGLTQNNIWIYNLYFPLECAILTAAAIIYFGSRKLVPVCLVAYGLFIVVYVWQLVYEGFDHLANLGVAAEAFLLVTLYLFLLYNVIRSPGFALTRSAELWGSLGIVLYFACIVPYFSAMNYLNVHNLELSAQLFYFINTIISNIRYLLAALGFWFAYRNRLVSLTSAL